MPVSTATRRLGVLVAPLIAAQLGGAPAGHAATTAAGMGLRVGDCTGTVLVTDTATGDDLGGLNIEENGAIAGYTTSSDNWTHFDLADIDSDGYYVLSTELRGQEYDLGNWSRTPGDFRPGKPDYAILGPDQNSPPSDLWSFEDSVMSASWPNQWSARVPLVPYDSNVHNHHRNTLFGVATDLDAMEAKFVNEDFWALDLRWSPDAGTSCTLFTPCERARQALRPVRERLQRAKARLRAAIASGVPRRIERARAHKMDVRGRLASAKAEVARECQ